jgi:hypothetical protein
MNMCTPVEEQTHTLTAAVSVVLSIVCEWWALDHSTTSAPMLAKTPGQDRWTWEPVLRHDGHRDIVEWDEGRDIVDCDKGRDTDTGGQTVRDAYAEDLASHVLAMLAACILPGKSTARPHTCDVLDMVWHMTK